MISYTALLKKMKHMTDILTAIQDAGYGEFVVLVCLLEHSRNFCQCYLLLLTSIIGHYCRFPMASALNGLWGERCWSSRFPHGKISWATIRSFSVINCSDPSVDVGSSPIMVSMPSSSQLDNAVGEWSSPQYAVGHLSVEPLRRRHPSLTRSVSEERLRCQ